MTPKEEDLTPAQVRSRARGLIALYQDRINKRRAVGGVEVHIPLDDLENLLAMARALLEARP